MPASTSSWSTPRTVIPRHVLQAVNRIKRLSNSVQVVAGNIATTEAPRR